MDIALGLGAALLLIGANAFFVAAEFSLVAVDRNRIDRLAAEGNRRARVAAGLLKRLSFNLSGAQLGITITSLVLGFVAEPTIARALQPLLDRTPLPSETTLGVSIALALLLATATQMVLGELFPKGLAIARPVRLALALAIPTRVYGAVFGPLIVFLNGAANWTVRRLGIEPREELLAVRSVEELELLIRSSGVEGTLDEDAVSLLTRSIRFGDKTAADAMVPRGSVTSVARNATVTELARTALETGHSRFPVRGEDIHDVVGVAHAKDVFGVPPQARSSTHVTGIAREVLAVPESQDLESLLLRMRAEAQQLAVVVDEHGSTAGIVTIEDLVEEIVGEIEDEYDLTEIQAPPDEQPGTFVLEGSLHPDEVLEATGFEAPEGSYHTLAGFLLSRFERIPEPGERFEHSGWTFEVLERDRLRISLVRVIPPPQHPAADA